MSVKVKILSEGFSRMAGEKVAKDGAAYNTGILELAWEWKATQLAQGGTPQAPGHQVTLSPAPEPS